MRAQLEVKMRGRWSADSSMARYEKHALLIQRFESLPKAVKDKSLVATKALHKLVLRSWA